MIRCSPCGTPQLSHDVMPAQKNEFMVSEIRNKKECQKSKLREAMPTPRFPDKFIYLGTEMVRGKKCDHWREDHGEETVEYFETVDGHIPVRLTTEAIEKTVPVLPRKR